ncbi:cytochrome c [Paraflavitalea sp. CAU 1676]|uniref:c-type cytochrome n=1 Tax=Paraflavitalea sp. CAU 1676 TaxID=3032598 RepID=UPI0023D9BA16|nr:cytochrome c [Paraflavitalea sp. CAU 1676]MDF2190375.1 cytochrome c [Paraflavitalea sp. CAU 1676]
MKTILFSTLLGTLLVAQAFMPLQAKPSRTSRTGKELFERHCKLCHGKDGTKGFLGAKNLQTSQLDEETLYTTIAKGRKVMPAWEKKLDTAELQLVVAYVKTLRK